MKFYYDIRSFLPLSLLPKLLPLPVSAGIGRTGLLIMLETALCKMEVQEAIYPLDIVRHMRDQRGLLVQTPVRVGVASISKIGGRGTDWWA